MTILNKNWTKKQGSMAPEFEDALENMLTAVEDVMDTRYGENGQPFGDWLRPDISFTFGSKFIKIVHNKHTDRYYDHTGYTGERTPSTHVAGFIGLDGSIYMPAGWKKPALNGARGNIFAPDCGLSAFNDMGSVRYKS